MAISAYADFLPAMQPRLPDCPEYLITQALQLGGREFCIESECNTQELTAIDSVADQKDYTVAAPSDYEILRILQVRVRTEDEVTDGEDGTILDPNKYEFELQSLNLKFYAAPFTEVITSGLVVEVVVAPEEDNDTLNAQFLQRWSAPIKAWALFYLYSIEGRTWSSTSLASFYYDKFRRGVSYGRREAHVLYTSYKPRMQAPSFL